MGLGGMLRLLPPRDEAVLTKTDDELMDRANRCFRYLGGGEGGGDVYAIRGAAVADLNDAELLRLEQLLRGETYESWIDVRADLRYARLVRKYRKRRGRADS